MSEKKLASFMESMDISTKDTGNGFRYFFKPLSLNPSLSVVGFQGPNGLGFRV